MYGGVHTVEFWLDFLLSFQQVAGLPGVVPGLQHVMLPLEKFPLNNFPLVLDGHCSLVLISKSKIMVSQCLCYLSFWQEIFILSQFRFCRHLLLWFPQISTISMWQLQGSGVPVLSSAVCFPVPALLLLVAVPSGSHRQSQLQSAILHFGLHLLSLH